MYYYRIAKQDQEGICLVRVDDNSFYDYQFTVDFGNKFYLMPQDLISLPKSSITI